jgi:hypothetical protein
MPLVRPKTEADSIAEALAHKPDVMYHLLDALPGKLAATSPPVAEVRRLHDDVTLYARTSEQGTAISETALCAEHAAKLNVPMDEYTDATGNDELACNICGAGDPANDETVFWCPVCDAATDLREVDFDMRWNDIEIAEDRHGKPYGQVAQQDSNYDSIALLCLDGDHVLSMPEHFDIEWN